MLHHRPPHQCCLTTCLTIHHPLPPHLQAYAMMCTAVRLVVTDQQGKSGRATLLSTQPGQGLRANIGAVLGARLAESLVPLELGQVEGLEGASISGWVGCWGWWVVVLPGVLCGCVLLCAAVCGCVWLCVAVCGCVVSCAECVAALL